MAFGISAYRSLEGLCEPERAFLRALRGHVRDRVTWGVYADWLEEQGRYIEAGEARVKAQQASVLYQLRHKPTRKDLGRPIARLSKLLERVIMDEGASFRTKDSDGLSALYDAPLDELEIVLVRIRTDEVAVVSLAAAQEAVNAGIPRRTADNQFPPT